MMGHRGRIVACRLAGIGACRLAGLGLMVAIAGVGAVQADDGGGFFSRLFRGGSPAVNPYNARPRTDPPPGLGRTSPSPASQPAQAPANPADLPATPPVADPGPTGRITPRPRGSTAVTNADPILTRIAVGRSSDGTQFGMLMQIHADGTVIDSEGVHRLRPADLRHLGEVLSSGELARLHGHCASPSADYLEYVQITVYERRMGRLAAHTFSYAGNPQGCDPALKHLHQALEELQLKLSRVQAPTPAAATQPASHGPSGPPVPLELH